jgi:hypothetical protein
MALRPIRRVIGGFSSGERLESSITSCCIWFKLSVSAKAKKHSLTEATFQQSEGVLSSDVVEQGKLQK